MAWLSFRCHGTNRHLIESKDLAYGQIKTLTLVLATLCMSCWCIFYTRGSKNLVEKVSYYNEPKISDRMLQSPSTCMSKTVRSAFI